MGMSGCVYSSVRVLSSGKRQKRQNQGHNMRRQKSDISSCEWQEPNGYARVPLQKRQSQVVNIEAGAMVPTSVWERAMGVSSFTPSLSSSVYTVHDGKVLSGKQIIHSMGHLQARYEDVDRSFFILFTICPYPCLSFFFSLQLPPFDLPLAPTQHHITTTDIEYSHNNRSIPTDEC